MELQHGLHVGAHGGGGGGAVGVLEQAVPEPEVSVAGRGVVAHDVVGVHELQGNWRNNSFLSIHVEYNQVKANEALSITP